MEESFEFLYRVWFEIVVGLGVNYLEEVERKEDGLFVICGNNLYL